MKNAPFTSAAIDAFGEASQRDQFKIVPAANGQFGVREVDEVERVEGMPDAAIITVHIQNDYRNQTKLVSVVDYHGRTLYRGTFDL